MLTLKCQFPEAEYDISLFLYILIGGILLYIVFAGIIIGYEFQRTRYFVSNKMLGYINHEIRNPLNCINGLLDISLDTLQNLGTDNVLHDLKTAKQACILLNHIVDDILDIDKISKNKLNIIYTKTNIPELIEEIKNILVPKFGEKPLVDFLVDCSVDYIITDRLRLTQIIMNFLSNSIKYTVHGYIKLSVLEDNDMIKFVVQDTGKGIAKHDFKKIFQPYAHVGSLDSLRHGGIGLGLVLCKELVKLMNGSIGFESELNHGCTFWVKLPKRDLPT